MRVLCLHPQDDPENGPWMRERWDRVVDLGVSGEQTSARWSEKFSCSVERIANFEIEDFAFVRQALSDGLGKVVDEYGLDWWELISIRFHEQIALIVRLKKLAAQLMVNDEVFVTRSGFHAAILRFLLQDVRCFHDAQSHISRSFRVIANIQKFNCTQLLQTVGDKYDAGYRVRRWLAKPAQGIEGAVVLLPVAQGNAARTALGYASIIPDRKFLMISTRSSGWVKSPPANVTAAKLASYAGEGSGRDCHMESRRLLQCWKKLNWDHSSDISLLHRAGLFSGITKIFRDGLAIRNAWLGVFRKEQVSSVVCADDTNPYTHMPLLIARQRGLPTIACHHGALDGGHLVKRSHADVALAKGCMEKDYLVNKCGLPPEKIQVGAPLLQRRLNFGARQSKDSIVFFSEPYALDGGRCREFYRELLPSLADLASQMNLRLIVKLHPMESRRERRKFMKAALLPRQLRVVRMLSGSLSEELLDRTKLAVTVQSTAAVDCAIRGIPVFLCRWLDYSYYGYVEQFIRYRVGVPLYSPAEIAKIPDLLENFSGPVPTDFWQTLSHEKLEHLLSGKLKMAMAV